jgi:hypothetical protein
MERSELIGKLQALLQYTVERGCTADEAEAAAKKINDLLVKYNLSLAEVRDVEPDTEMGYAVPMDKNADGKTIRHYKMPDWLHRLAVSIGRLNFCEVVGNDTAIYLGLKKDGELAVYMFETLVRQLRQQVVTEHRTWVKAQWGERQPKETMWGSNHPRVWKESWLEGAASALTSRFFWETWERETEKNPTPSTALVLDKRATAIAYAKSQYPRWFGIGITEEEREQANKEAEKEEKRERDNQRNHDAYMAGYKKGESITVTPGLGGSDKSPKPLKE